MSFRRNPSSAARRARRSATHPRSASSRTRRETTMPSASASLHRRKASCTVAPKRSLWFATGSPAWMPIRTLRLSAASALYKEKRRWMSAAERTALGTSSNAAMIPSPVCFTSRPSCAASARLTSASCTRTSSSAAASPSRVVSSVEPTMSVTSTARSPVSIAGGRTARVEPRIANTAEERLDRGEIDRNDVGGDFAMRFAVDVRRRRRVGRIDQAEAGAAVRVKPIGHVFDPVFVLNLEVLAMRFGDILGRHIAHVVAVHENRHGGAHSLLIRGIWDPRGRPH